MTRLRARSLNLLAGTSVCLLLAACSGVEPEMAAQPDDPVVSGALGDNLMIDLDLTGQNQANAAISDGSRDGALPPLDVSEEAIDKAMAEAVALVGGLAEMQALGAVQQIKDAPETARPITVLARIASADFVPRECSSKADTTAAWAARIPKALPIYPRGAVQAAVGVEDVGCSARAVTYRTPVPQSDVMDFYFTIAAKAGFKTKARQIGDELELRGAKANEAFSINVRPVSSGITQVVLVTNGG